MLLCWAFTAADFSYCLFVGLFTFNFVFSKWNACSIGLKSGNWLGRCRIFHFLPTKTLGLLLLYVLGHRPFVLWSTINFAPFDWIWADSISLYTSEFFRLLLSSVTSSLNTSDSVPLEAMLMPSHCSTMFHRWCCVLWIMSYSKPSPYFFLPVILVKVDLNFSCPKNTFPEVVWLFKKFFWAKSTGASQ